MDRSPNPIGRIVLRPPGEIDPWNTYRLQVLDRDQLQKSAYYSVTRALGKFLLFDQ